MTLRRAAALLATVALLALGACTSSPSAAPSPPSSSHRPTVAATSAQLVTYTVQMPHAYQPVPPPGGGTDDYHCTLVDPHVTTNRMIVSSEFFPNSIEVHHAILFVVPPSLAAQARAVDEGGKGWTCFGEAPLPNTNLNVPFSRDEISNTPWLTAWAPGHGLDVVPEGTGVEFPAGSLVVMQIHYNLLQGDKPVRSTLVLHTVAATSALQPLLIDLLPAPPDIPCPAGVTGPLCNRAASLADLGTRFGAAQEEFVNLVEAVCGRNSQDPPGGDTTSCTWPIQQAGYIERLTPHMHLLGRGMTITLDPGTSHARTLLDVTNYNFDYQRSYNVATPVKVSAGDTMRVTCTYDPRLRQELPQLRKLPPRYVTWGDGSSDEMCLAIVNSVAQLPTT